MTIAEQLEHERLFYARKPDATGNAPAAAIVDLPEENVLMKTPSHVLESRPLRQMAIAIERQRFMRWHRIVGKAKVPPLPILVVGVISEPDRRVLIVTPADGTRVPSCGRHFRKIRRIVAQAAGPEPIVKLAIAK